MKNKLKKSKGFTLIELIVVIAVTSIFLGMSAIILNNTFNIFGNLDDEYGNVSDTILTETLISTFINNVNKEGLPLELSKNNNYYYLETKEVININPLFKLSIEGLNIKSYQLESNNEYSSLTRINENINLQLEIIEGTKNLKITYLLKDNVIRTNIFNIIGGINYA